MDLFQNMIQDLKDDKFLRSESFITLDELAHFWKFKKKEFDIKLEKYRLHISDLLGHSCYIDWNYTNEMNAGIRFCWYSLFSLTSHALVINCHNFKFENVSSSYDDFLKKLFQNDNETKEFIEWFRNWTDKYNVLNHMSHHFFNIYFNYYYNKFEYVVFLF